jgi:magnesium-transporting ATPase (P-type)
VERPTQKLLEIAALTNEAALTRLSSGWEGLSDKEAKRRLRKYGANAIRRVENPGLAKELLTRLSAPLNLLLLILALVSFVLDDHKMALLIAVIVD